MKNLFTYLVLNHRYIKIKKEAIKKQMEEPCVKLQNQNDRIQGAKVMIKYDR